MQIEDHIQVSIGNTDKMALFKLVQSDDLEDGQIIMDKEAEILYYKNMIDWFVFMKTYDKES